MEYIEVTSNRYDDIWPLYLRQLEFDPAEAAILDINLETGDAEIVEYKDQKE
jgi:hypothetical protein